jgi:hypothetical protein
MCDSASVFSGVLGVPSVLANAGAGFSRNTCNCRGVPGVPTGFVLEHLEHHRLPKVFHVDPHEIRLEHQEHLEHLKNTGGEVIFEKAQP